MTLTPRESVLALSTAALIVFAVSGMLVRPQIERWQRLRSEREVILDDIDLSQHLVGMREEWQRQYRELSRSLPTYAHDERMDVYWLSVMDQVAARNNLTINRRQVGQEEQRGIVYELPIEAPDWEGSLDAIVRFLYDVQNEEGMLDVRQLIIRPRGDGQLRGRFSLACLYARAPAEEES